MGKIINVCLFSLTNHKELKMYTGKLEIKTMSSSAIFRDSNKEHKNSIFCSKEEGVLSNNTVWYELTDHEIKNEGIERLQIFWRKQARDLFLQNLNDRIEDIDTRKKNLLQLKESLIHDKILEDAEK